MAAILIGSFSLLLTLHQLLYFQITGRNTWDDMWLYNTTLQSEREREV
jgi:hypothetical protein